MKRILILVLLIISALCVQAQTKDAILDSLLDFSFNGDKLGEKRGEIKRLAFLKKAPIDYGGDIDWYRKDGEIVIGLCKLDSLKYGFHKNRLYKITGKIEDPECFENNFYDSEIIPEGFHGAYFFYPYTSSLLMLGRNRYYENEAEIIRYKTAEVELIINLTRKEFLFSRLFLTKKQLEWQEKEFQRWKELEEIEANKSPTEKAIDYENYQKEAKRLEKKDKRKKKFKSFFKSKSE